MPALFGHATSRGTVAFPSVAWYFHPTSLTATVSMAAPTRAFRRRPIGDRPAADVGLPGVADALELATEDPAVVVAQPEHPVHVEDAREGARGDHRRREARPFLVGPAHELERPLRPDAPLVERAQHLEPGQDTDDAVILPAGDLGVEVAAHQHRRQMILRPRTPREA